MVVLKSVSWFRLLGLITGILRNTCLGCNHREIGGGVSPLECWIPRKADKFLFPRSTAKVSTEIYFLYEIKLQKSTKRLLFD